MTPTPPPLATSPAATPGLLARTRTARLVVWAIIVLALGGWLAADRTGLLGRFAQVAGALDGRLDLGHGVTVERVRLTSPPCQLLVARVPRRAGLRLQAARLTEVVAGRRDAPPGLAPLGVVSRLGALVAINGDFHRLDGLCDGLPFSTLVTGRAGEAAPGQPAPAGRAATPEDCRTIGSPFDYACAFHVGADGAPAISTLDLGAALRFPSGRAAPVLVDLCWGDALLLAHPPRGAWTPPVCARHALPLREGEAPATWRVTGGWRQGALQGPALLRSAVDDALRAEATAGATLALELTGRDAGLALAIGTGPRLVEQGEVPARLEAAPGDPQGWPARVARSAVGLTDDHLLLVCTLQAPRQGLSMGDLARALRALGARDALNLDGGPSTGLWGAGRILNMDAAYEPNDVATALVVLPPGGEGVELR